MAVELAPDRGRLKGQMDTKEAQQRFDEFNERYFGGKLPRYRVVVSELYVSGYCDKSKRAIHLNPAQADSATLLHEMAHIVARAGHAAQFEKEIRRAKKLGAPVADMDCVIYSERKAASSGQAQIIAAAKDHGFEGPEVKWVDYRRSEGYRVGLVNRHGRASCNADRRVLEKMRAALHRGQRERRSMDRAKAVAGGSPPRVLSCASGRSCMRRAR